MDIFRNVADSVTKAVTFVVDQNRKTALINRLKIVIENEKEVKARAYIELGKYYYENLREEENDRTERVCEAIDNADRRLKKAYTRLDELVRPTGTSEDACCTEDCCCGEQAAGETQPFEEEASEEVTFGEEPAGETAPVEAARSCGCGETADDDGFPPE